MDELSTKEECAAARTIQGRGAAVIASVHADSLAQLCGDPERSVLIGGVASVTLSAREAEARPDKLRQVSRRYHEPVFGVVVECAPHTRTDEPRPNTLRLRSEPVASACGTQPQQTAHGSSSTYRLRGFHDWVIHKDMAEVVDAYLDFKPFRAVRHVAESALADRVECTPIVACRQQGSAMGCTYAHLLQGERLGSNLNGEVDFQSKTLSGQQEWTLVSATTPYIYQRTALSAQQTPSPPNVAFGIQAQFKFGSASPPVTAFRFGAGLPRADTTQKPAGSVLFP